MEKLGFTCYNDILNKWKDYSHLKAVSVVSGPAARGHQAPEVSAPRHAPSTHSTLRSSHASLELSSRLVIAESSHAPLSPAVGPAGGHEDVVTIDNLVRKEKYKPCSSIS